MEKIDYESEVRKVYPEAYHYMPEHFDIYVIKDRATGKELGRAYFHEQAWRSAYENLTQQGKITPIANK